MNEEIGKKFQALAEIIDKGRYYPSKNMNEGTILCRLFIQGMTRGYTKLPGIPSVGTELLLSIGDRQPESYLVQGVRITCQSFEEIPEGHAFESEVKVYLVMKQGDYEKLPV
jgi:hypothetical protein